MQVRKKSGSSSSSGSDANSRTIAILSCSALADTSESTPSSSGSSATARRLSSSGRPNSRKLCAKRLTRWISFFMFSQSTSNCAASAGSAGG